MSASKEHFHRGPGVAGSGRGNWHERRACLVCGHQGFCQLTRDGGAVQCHYVASNIERDGLLGRYWIHHLDGAVRAPRHLRFVPAPRAALAPVDVLDRAYRAVLSQLSISAAHLAALAARGISTAEATRRGYCTLEVRGRAAIARAIVDAVGEGAALTIPGIVRREGEHGPYLSFGGSAGLVVPVRDAQGRIVALCIRRDEGAPKYLVISSAKHGGASPGAPLHWPLFDGSRELIVLTEGLLKSDIATHLSGRLVLGLPGVGAWRLALEAVAELQPARIVVAFDSDAARNVHVARAQAELVRELRAAGHRVGLKTWPESQGKGIDNLLYNQARARAGEVTGHE